ncbi:MAG: hypothetical protein KGM17_05455 [Sphingomonadales bacterium]|nr:hypothetical protein [Sphingomonadales bacterium]
MASKTSSDKQPPVLDMAELGQRLAARRATLGQPELPRNTGKRRTASKQALLQAIKDAGGEW